MHFRDYQAVLDGRKTQTRRPKQEGECLVIRGADMKTVLTPSGRVKWQEGRRYAIQPPGRGNPLVGRFTLLDIREELVQDISEGDAFAEGIGNPDFDDEISGSCLASIAGGCGACENCDPVWYFKLLWNDIWKYRPEYQWKANPDVWVLVIEV